jgi:hypothetical protein
MPRLRPSPQASRSGAGRRQCWWASPAARHRRDPGDGRRGLERGAKAAPTVVADNQLAITGSGWSVVREGHPRRGGHRWLRSMPRDTEHERSSIHYGPARAGARSRVAQPDVVARLWQHVGPIFCYRRDRPEGSLGPRSSHIGRAARKARRRRRPLRFALRAGLIIHAPATIAKAKTPGMTASQLPAAANAPAPPQLNEDRASAKVAMRDEV